MRNSLMEALDRFGRSTGEYWSADNARFEAGNPNLLDRAVRSLNPMTGLGSAVGGMYDGASNGSIADMAAALLQALPTFGATRTFKGTFGGVLTPAMGKTAAALGLGTAGSVATDEYQAAQARPRN